MGSVEAKKLGLYDLLVESCAVELPRVHEETTGLVGSYLERLKRRNACTRAMNA